MTRRLTCHACGSTASFGDAKRCECGEGLWFDTEPGDFEWPAGDEHSLWRYRDLLPAADATGLAGTVGDTSLVRLPALDDEIGARLHVKYEGENPTGTFKDRGSAVGVTVASESGAKAVGTVSHGNMARSMAAHAASAGIPCVVLVPADIPSERLGLIARHDPTILRVEGAYDRLYYESLRIERDRPITFVNSDTPLRVAGQKTTGLEIIEAFAPDVPEAVVMPVSSGGHASAVWKAFRELSAAGLIDSPPRLFLVQTAACGPIAAADERDADTVHPVDSGETVAYSIANADPPSGNRALAAVRATDGEAVAVDDEQILAARRTLSERAGLFVETAAATTLAGARRLADRGAFDRDDDVVLVATGTGFTERDVDAPDVTAESVPMDALDDALGDVLGQ
jgi:threonine synthase